MIHQVYKWRYSYRIGTRPGRPRHNYQLVIQIDSCDQYNKARLFTSRISFILQMKTILKPIQKLRQSYEKVLAQNKPLNYKTLNLKLLFNPFIKDQDHYKAVYSELMIYNKKVLEKMITDQYEVNSHQKLFSVISDLGNLEAREDMVTRLEQTWKWWVEQRRRIKQRRDLGIVKYKADRNSDKVKDILQKMHQSQVIHQSSNLPTQIRYNQIFPYEMSFRTSHRQMDVPLRRLSEYKRKIINISDNHMFDLDQTKIQKEKVTYPRPKKYVPPEEAIENDSVNPTQENNQPEQPPNPQSIEAAKNPPNPQNPAPAQQNPAKPEQEEQDLGIGLGEQPGQPQQDGGQEQAPQQDKLAPKNKIYTWSNKQREEYNQMKKYQKPYMFYKGCDNHAQRRMEQKTVLKQQYSLKLQREEKDIINKAHQWAGQKQKITKQRQQSLQLKLLKPSYSFAYQDPQKKQMLSLADQKKYGFYAPTKATSKPQIQLDDKLPSLTQYKPVEKEIRKDRLSSLRHKFANILNLRESAEEHALTSSLCQVSPRRRDLSMILQQHSPQKQRQLELQQIRKIKQSLGKHRININIKTLAQALVPNTQQYKQQQFQSPPKQLPNNPFFVQPKKKKKK